MERSLEQQTREIAKKRVRKSRWRRIVSALSVVVVFVTTYALILPAITMENATVCGIKEHSHTDGCYEEREYLSCGIEETDGHTHDENCYDAYGNLICVKEEREGHKHGEACYSKERLLICPLEEHIHSGSCYPEEEAEEEDKETRDEAVAGEEAEEEILPCEEVKLTSRTEDDITVTLTAPLDAFDAPEGELALEVERVKSREAKELIESEVKGSRDGKTRRETLLFDIKVMSGGCEVQPQRPVTVTFEGIETPRDDAEVFHVDTEKKTAENLEATTEKNGDIRVETEHFSVYGVTFTVDFHYGDYTFSMNGKDIVYLSKIFEALHIEKGISDIEKVEFSNPNLLSVESWTLNGSPDFLLTSLASFDSEETLTVLFEDESKIIIRVTDPTLGPNTSNKVVVAGTTSNFMTNMPFTAVSIDPAKCYMSLAEFSTSNGIAFHFGSTTSYSGTPVIAPYFLGSIAPNSTINIIGSYTLTFRDAATLINGQKANVVVTVSGITLLNRASSTTLSKVLFSGTDPICQIGCWGFSDESTLAPATSAAMQADVNIKITYSDGSVIGVGQPVLWSCRDIDACYGAPYFESYTVLSGALSKAYVPTTNYLNITNETANYNDTANGLKFTATQYDSGTYNTGFAMLTESAGIDLRWKGSSCATFLFEKDLSISVRPQYKAYEESGLSNWNTGDTGGTISMTDVSNASNLIWQASGATSAGYMMRFCGYGKNIPMTVGAKEGYILTDFVVNGTSAVGDISNNSYTVSNMQTNHSVDVFYRPVTGSVTITKTDEKTGELLTGAVFTVSGTSSIHGAFTLTSTDNGDGTYSISNVPYGKNTDVYTISETTAPTNYDTAPDQVVTGDQFAQNGSNIPLSFKDKSSVHTLTISKTVIGTGSGSFDFKVTMKNTAGIPVIIPADTASPATYAVNTATGEVTFSLKHGESVKLKSVPVGTIATVKETQHDGYSVIIKDGGGAVLSNGDSAEVAVSADKTVSVINNAGVVLPSTGGRGSLSYVLFGYMLCISVAAVYILKRRERERRGK